MKKFSSTAVIWLGVLALILVCSMFINRNNTSTKSIAFSEFKQDWTENKVKSFELQDDNITLKAVLSDDTNIETIVPSERLFNFIAQNEKSSDVVKESYAQPTKIPGWVAYLPSILLLVLMVVMLVMFFQQSQGGGSKGFMSFGKSKARLANPDKKKVTFKDVAGEDEEKEELAEIVDFLKQPSRYINMGARIPKGVLLIGPPGTGKTLLAKAVSGEAGVPFFSISGSDFVEMFVGVGASRVRDMFEQAKKNAPCIVFIDEIDAVGRQRGTGLGGSHDEREQTLNQLLVEMDGFGVNEGIIIIAATNRPDILDKALLRPGRFDRQVYVGVPDVKGREEILKVHSVNKHLAEGIQLGVLAKRTPGFTGADLENIMNEAALLAVRNDKTEIGMVELEEAITRVVAGPEKKSRVITEEDRRLTAFHEAGHAVVMKSLPHCDPVHEISIIPRGMAGGYTMHLPEKDATFTSKAKLVDELSGLLGGRVAEKLVIGDISTGAKNDIDRASDIARKLVMEYGMSDVLGPISFENSHDEVFLGRDIGRSRNFCEDLGSSIDKEIMKFIDDAYVRAQKILTENMDKLTRVAEALLDKEKLEGEEFERLYAGNDLIGEV